jgi:hypothetical protein
MPPRSLRTLLLALLAATATLAATGTVAATATLAAHGAAAAQEPAREQDPLHAESARVPSPRIQQVSVRLVGALTGPDAAVSTQAVDVCGTDIGTMAELDGTIYFAFGDTFGFRGDDCPRHGPNWRSNALAYSRDLDPSDGIHFDGWLTNDLGRAVAITEGAHQRAFTEPAGEQTRIPTALVAVDGRLVLHVMSVHGFAPQGGVWTCNASLLFVSEDRGATWWQADGTFGTRDSGFNMLALTNEAGAGNEEGRFVYALGTPCGRFGGVRVARVPAADVVDLAAWRYLREIADDGTPTWSPDEAEAMEVIPAPVGEASILWHPFLERWLYSYLNEHTAAIELREAPHPWGPWSEPHVLVTAQEYPQLYGAFMTPSFLQDEGRRLYFVMSRFGPYNTFIMEATLDW